MAYVDTSLLVAYYCPEPLSPAAQQAMRREESVSISSLVEVEFYSALAMKVRAGGMTGADADAVGAAFRAHLHDGLYRFLAVGGRHFEQAAEWLRLRSTGLRSLDALHLAVAALAGEKLLTADRAFAAAAEVLSLGCERIE
jgi:predicted nucleic acid-binding protein